MTTSTIRLHRVLRCPPERIYKAFTDPGAFERWRGDFQRFVDSFAGA